MRIREIDFFRGISILLMIFFSIIVRLGDSLPDLLQHNVEKSLHFGDLVLPMFLFASGMSMFFFTKKHMKNFHLDAAERIGKLLLFSFFITPFSVGALFGMDEVMLSLVLFIPTIFLLRFGDRTILAVCLVLLASYFFTDFLSDDYLGGYGAAPFYLPVMLAGAVAGRNLSNLKYLLGFWIIVTGALLLIIPPYKMEASPSFMALSIVLSLVLFMAASRARNGILEEMGKRPFRYWIIMWYIILIPITFYAIFQTGRFPIGLGAVESVGVAVASIFIIYAVERLISKLLEKYGKMKPGSLFNT